jgi:uncharacterized protein
LSLVEKLVEQTPPPDRSDIDHAFWQACHGGQRRAAELLLARGADVRWIPDYAGGTAVDAAAGPDTRRDLLVTWLRERGADHAN